MGFTQIVELHQNGQMDANRIKAFAKSIEQDIRKHPPEQVFGPNTGTCSFPSAQDLSHRNELGPGRIDERP
jgi:hypothetical protein